MLSTSALKRLDFMLTLECLFCIIPCDWNFKKKKLTKTKSIFKLYLHTFMVLLCTAIFIYIGFWFSFDIWYGRLSIAKMFILGLYLWIGVLVTSLAWITIIFIDEFAFVTNNMFLIDKHFQEFGFSTKYLDSIQSQQKQIIIQLSNVIEPLSIVHTISLCLLFFENFDPFRRYFYNPFIFIVGFWIPGLELEQKLYPQIIGLLVYMVFVRLCYSFVIFYCFLMSFISQELHYWVSFLYKYSVKNDNNIPKESYLTMYRILHVTYHTLQNSAVCKILLPCIIMDAFVPVTIGVYGAVKLFGQVNWGAYVLLPTVSIFIIVFTKKFWIEAAEGQELMTQFIKSWKSNIQPMTKDGIWFQKYLKGCGRDYITIGSYFNGNHETFVLYCEQVLDTTINLLLDF